MVGGAPEHVRVGVEFQGKDTESPLEPTPHCRPHFPQSSDSASTCPGLSNNESVSPTFPAPSYTRRDADPCQGWDGLCMEWSGVAGGLLPRERRSGLSHNYGGGLEGRGSGERSRRGET